MALKAKQGTVKYRNDGFTLIEILVAMVIMGIVASVAVLSLQANHHRQLQSLTQGLTHFLHMEQQEALLQPATIRIALEKYPLPHGTELTLKMQGKNIPLQKTHSSPIIISSNGDITPFTLLIGLKGQLPRYKIVGEESGVIHFESIA